MIEFDNKGNLPDYNLEIIISKDKRFREEMDEAIEQATYIFSNRKDYGL